MDFCHLKGKPEEALCLRRDEMWRYLLLCIIRFTGDYTLYPQRLDFPAFEDERSSGLGAKNISPAPPPQPHFLGFMSVLACN